MTVAKKTLEAAAVAGKRVLMRVDFNVPLDKKTGAISDDQRIRAALPSIRYLLQHEARVILVSHLGRPKNGPEEKFSMRPAADRLAELLGQEVQLAADVVGDDAKAKAAALRNGEILMLENVRFHREETDNDPAFARDLAALAEIYVNDAFGTAHRAHASTAGVAAFLPSYAGFLIARELEMIAGALDEPKRPFVAILGGAKVSDKIGVIANLLNKVDTLLIGGGMAFTFLKAKGYEIGSSLCEADKVDLARELLQEAEAKGVELLLPLDVQTAASFAAEAEACLAPVEALPADRMGLDIGPRTIEAFAARLAKAGTVVWNGPMGVFEFPTYAVGTREIARAVAASAAVSIIGGGDSAAAIEQLGFADQVTHISTGGGASLEFLEGKTLPGLAALQDRQLRRKMAAANWKMNVGTPQAASKLLNAFKQNFAKTKAQVLVAVPATVLATAAELVAYTDIQIAAQNCHFEEKGAFTGEVSPRFLAEMQIPYVLIGHSERRAYFAETNETCNKKIKAARAWGLKPVFCCGESLETREAGETEAFIDQQIREGLAGLPAEQMRYVTLAYEPIWAIGTGKTATAEQAEQVCAHIRRLLAELYDAELAEATPILYGGSCNEKNAAELFAQANIDGGLVGGASLKPEAFKEIVHAAAEA